MAAALKGVVTSTPSQGTTERRGPPAPEAFGYVSASEDRRQPATIDAKDSVDIVERYHCRGSIGGGTLGRALEEYARWRSRSPTWWMCDASARRAEPEAADVAADGFSTPPSGRRCAATHSSVRLRCCACGSSMKRSCATVSTCRRLRRRISPRPRGDGAKPRWLA
jgi:hypothetical protein